MDNIKLDTEQEAADIYLASNVEQRRTDVNMVAKFRLNKMWEIALLTDQGLALEEAQYFMELVS